MRAHAFLRPQSQIVAVPWNNFALNEAAESPRKEQKTAIAIRYVSHL
jgi:hypothetical protein